MLIRTGNQSGIREDYAKYLNNDIKIREYLEKNLKDAAIASVIIERKKTDVKLLFILLNQVL